MEVLPHYGCVFRSCRVQLHIQILAEHVDSIERANDRERELKGGEALRPPLSHFAISPFPPEVFQEIRLTSPLKARSERGMSSQLPKPLI